MFDSTDSPGPPLPSRIRVAQSFIEFCRGITEPCCGDDLAKRRELSPRERSAYEASIETIRAFVIGELELTEARPTQAPATDPAVAPPAPTPPAGTGEASADKAV